MITRIFHHVAAEHIITLLRILQRHSDAADAEIRLPAGVALVQQPRLGGRHGLLRRVGRDEDVGEPAAPGPGQLGVQALLGHRLDDVGQRVVADVERLQQLLVVVDQPLKALGVHQ